MALELESEIMKKIGFGLQPNWYSGSGSCVIIRETAAARLPKVIKEYNAASQKIAPPQPALTELVERAAQTLDRSEFSLDKTWQIASDVIRIHMELAGIPKRKLAECVEQARAEIVRVYFGEGQEAYPYDTITKNDF